MRVGTDGVHIKPRMEGGERRTGTSDILKGKWKEAENDRKGEREGERYGGTYPWVEVKRGFHP